MNRNDTIEKLRRKVEMFLYITNHGPHLRKTLPDSTRHLVTKFECIVLHACELLICNMLAQPGTDLEHPWSIYAGDRPLLQRIRVVKSLDRSIVLWQNLVPVLDEVLTDSCLFSGQCRKLFGPGSSFDGLDSIEFPEVWQAIDTTKNR